MALRAAKRMKSLAEPRTREQVPVAVASGIRGRDFQWIGANMAPRSPSCSTPSSAKTLANVPLHYIDAE
jgi:hypothetical protein